MSFWDNMFDSEYRQRKDINTLRANMMDMSDVASAVEPMRGEVTHMRMKLDQLGLLCEALVQLLELKGGFKREELTLMIQRLDLADGVEDGRIGPNHTAGAPKCPNCNRPANPKREACIYCYAPLPKELPEAEAAQKMVKCTRCSKDVAENSAYFSEVGLLCYHCFEGGLVD